MYIVVGQESSSDHFLEDQAYGPFDTYEEADAFADKKAISEENVLTPYVDHRFTYSVIELVKP